VKTHVIIPSCSTDILRATLLWGSSDIYFCATYFFYSISNRLVFLDGALFLSIWPSRLSCWLISIHISLLSQSSLMHHTSAVFMLSLAHILCRWWSASFGDSLAICETVAAAPLGMQWGWTKDNLISWVLNNCTHTSIGCPRKDLLLDAGLLGRDTVLDWENLTSQLVYVILDLLLEELINLRDKLLFVQGYSFILSRPRVLLL